MVVRLWGRSFWQNMDFLAAPGLQACFALVCFELRMVHRIFVTMETRFLKVKSHGPLTISAAGINILAALEGEAVMASR